jgi:hypothetical protein
MIQNLGNNTIMPVVEPPPFNKVGQYIFKTNYLASSPPPECAKSNPPCPYMPNRREFKAGEAVDGKMTGQNLDSNGLLIPMSLLALNPIDARNTGREMNDKATDKDPWTGKPEWNKIFSIQNFWRLVIVMIFLYLFLKYMLPLIKSSFKKA